MTRLLVLGGGRHQVPLIRRAEEREIEVVLVDYLTDAPGRAYASHVELADATDPGAATEIARAYRVDGVTTTGTDIPIRAMAAVSADLDLPGYVDGTGARLATDKQAMYEALTALGVPMAVRTVIDWDSESPVPARLPVVVKPADSQGQRGVSAVRDRDALASAVAAARSASRAGQVLVEEFLEGPEFTANAWIEDGRISLLMVNDRITFNPHPYLGIAFQHRYPSHAAMGDLDLVSEITSLTARAYGVTTGPLYIQMIETVRGPVVVEAAARIGGGHESRLIDHLTGWNSDDALIDLALGQRPGTPAPLPGEANVLVNFILGSEGVVAKLHDFRLADGIFEADWYVKEGDPLKDVTDGQGRVGYFLAEDSSPDALMETSSDYYRNLRLESDGGTNLVHVPDPELLNLP